MNVSIDAGWLMAVFLLSLRLGVIFMLSPIFSGMERMVTVRMMLTLVLSALFVSGAVSMPPHEIAERELFSAAFGELMVGITLAFGVFAAFGAFSIAGKIVDIQSGLGMGSVYDPVIRGGAPLFSTLLNMTGVAVFFAVDGHHALMRGLAFSLEHLPLGSGIGAIPLGPVVAQFGLMFSLGVALMIPVLLSLLLVETGLAVISRVLPQMNVIMVMVPAKVFAGLVVFALSVSSLRGPMSRVFDSVFTFWEQALRNG